MSVTGSPGDEALMLRFQRDGDAAAFETLFRRHKDELVSFLRRLSGSATVAEEVSQHCWLRVIELARQDRYRAVSGSTFRSFLYTLGRNRYIDAYVRSHGATRHASLETLEHDAGMSSGDADLADATAAEQRAALLAKALDGLPWEQREVIALWAAEFSIEEMARLTGAPRDTVLSRKKYALARLRKALEAMGMEHA